MFFGMFSPFLFGPCFVTLGLRSSVRGFSHALFYWGKVVCIVVNVVKKYLIIQSFAKNVVVLFLIKLHNSLPAKNQFKKPPQRTELLTKKSNPGSWL